MIDVRDTVSMVIMEYTMSQNTTRIDFFAKHVRFVCYICSEVTRIDVPSGRACVTDNEPNELGRKVIKEYAHAHPCLADKTKVLDALKGSH